MGTFRSSKIDFFDYYNPVEPWRDLRNAYEVPGWPSGPPKGLQEKKQKNGYTMAALYDKDRKQLVKTSGKKTKKQKK